MSTLLSFSFPFTVGWRSQDGWNGKAGPLIRFGDEIKGGFVNILPPPAGNDEPKISSRSRIEPHIISHVKEKDAEHELIRAYFTRP